MLTLVDSRRRCVVQTNGPEPLRGDVASCSCRFRGRRVSAASVPPVVMRQQKYDGQQKPPHVSGGRGGGGGASERNESLQGLLRDKRSENTRDYYG